MLCSPAFGNCCKEKLPTQTTERLLNPMTIPSNPNRKTRRAPFKVRQASRQAQAQNDSVTDQIMAEGAARITLATQAATVTEAALSPAEIQAWISDYQARLAVIEKHPEQNLGHIEEQLARSAKEPLRLLAQRAAQAKANATPCGCRDFQLQLVSQKYLARTVDSRFGPLHIFRAYGWCSQCEQWHFPADYALGLAKKAPASPYLQEISALLVSKMPPEQACLVAEPLGLDLSRCLLHREAHRQGLKAQAMRAQAVAQLDTWAGIQQLAGQTDGPPAQPFTLVIEIDAWNIRERDD